MVWDLNPQDATLRAVQWMDIGTITEAGAAALKNVEVKNIIKGLEEIWGQIDCNACRRNPSEAPYLQPTQEWRQKLQGEQHG